MDPGLRSAIVVGKPPGQFPDGSAQVFTLAFVDVRGCYRNVWSDTTGYERYRLHG